MRNRETVDESIHMINLYPFADEADCITVSKHRAFDVTRTWRPAYIMWGNLGTATPEQAAAYAAALSEAARLAVELDERYAAVAAEAA